MKGKMKIVNARRWPGVYSYNSTGRMSYGKPDTCFYLSYKLDGKKVWEKAGWCSEGYSPEMAAELRADRLKAARHGEDVLTSKQIKAARQKTDRTLDEIKKAYFKGRGKTLKGKGYATDKNRYETHLEKIFGSKQISNFSPFDIERIKRNMKGKAPATICNVLELLRRIINYGAKNKLCSPLFFIIEFPKKDNEVTEYLTPEQFKKLLDVLNNWEPAKDATNIKPYESLKVADAPRMLKLALFSGLRRGEIFKLETDDIDFQQKLIRLRSPKGGRTESVPMSAPVMDLLKEQIAWRDERFPGSPYVFPGRWGGLRKDSSAVDRIKDEAGLPKKFRIFHGLRHNFAITLANSGEFTLDMIGELLTHKNSQVTRRYAKFLPDTKRDAADRAAELLNVQAKKQKKVIEIREAGK